jgi:hypothetical protein
LPWQLLQVAVPLPRQAEHFPELWQAMQLGWGSGALEEFSDPARTRLEVQSKKPKMRSRQNHALIFIEARMS